MFVVLPTKHRAPSGRVVDTRRTIASMTDTSSAPGTSSSDPAAPVSIPKKAEEALLFKLKEKALVECAGYAKAYADCCRGRLVSLAWKCRGEAHVLSDCTHRYTSQLERVKRRWQQAGCPAHPDWDRLLRGL